MPLRRLFAQPPGTDDRIVFFNTWYRGHNNARYSELLPRLERVDSYLLTFPRSRPLAHRGGSRLACLPALSRTGDLPRRRAEVPLRARHRCRPAAEDVRRVCRRCRRPALRRAGAPRPAERRRLRRHRRVGGAAVRAARRGAPLARRSSGRRTGLRSTSRRCARSRFGIASLRRASWVTSRRSSSFPATEAARIRSTTSRTSSSSGTSSRRSILHSGSGWSAPRASRCNGSARSGRASPCSAACRGRNCSPTSRTST